MENYNKINIRSVLEATPATFLRLICFYSIAFYHGCVSFSIPGYDDASNDDEYGLNGHDYGTGHSMQHAEHCNTNHICGIFITS